MVCPLLAPGRARAQVPPITTDAEVPPAKADAPAAPVTTDAPAAPVTTDAPVAPVKKDAPGVTLVKVDNWEVYTDGRAGAFLSYVHGDGLPRNTVDANGNLLHDIKGGGLDATASRQPIGTTGQLTQGTIDEMRVRSGFIANTLGLGVRRPLGPDYVVTAYIQIWAYVEATARKKSELNFADVRQGYVKVDAPWGSVLAGRSRALFSRGATDIDVMYAHRWGVGWPGNIDQNGPTAGHVGFGVLGSGFAAGLVYATPVLSGFQLTAGAYDPVQIQAGGWTRTRFVRPEGEATFERPLGTFGKFALFLNGAYEELFQDGSDVSTAAAGFGYGGRLELGPVHLGVAGHYGKGLGLSYALESSDANSDATNNVRTFDGYYVQSQFVVGPVDLSAGWGITRVFLNPVDNAKDMNGNIMHSIIKDQMGVSAGVVYNVKPWLHIDVDAFRAQFDWFLGERQIVYVLNGGMVTNW
jgi:hypothetical protein